MLTLATLGAAILGVVETLGKIGLAVEALKFIGNALIGIGKALGIIKPELSVEQLGDKAIQAKENGIVPDNFESFEKYVNAVQDFKTDPEKSVAISEKEKVAKGIEISGVLAQEKCPNLDVEKLVGIAANKGFFASMDRFAEICKLAVTNPGAVNSVVGFINGSLKNQSGIEDAVSTLKGIEKNISPNISDREALSRVLSFQG